MSAFASMLAALHADPNFGIDAQFQRPPNAPITLRVTWSAPSDVVPGIGSPPARAGSRQATLLARDLGALVPQRGDLMVVEGVTYRIDDTERPPGGLLTLVTLVAAPTAGQFAIGRSGIGATDTIG